MEIRTRVENGKISVEADKDAINTHLSIASFMISLTQELLEKIDDAKLSTVDRESFYEFQDLLADLSDSFSYLDDWADTQDGELDFYFKPQTEKSK